MANMPGNAPNVEHPWKLARSAELSSYRESMLEQLLCVELVQEAWLQDRPPLEFAHAFVDFSGYDLVVSCGPVTRHIQLKATAGRIVLSRSLASKPSGCCVLMRPDVISHEHMSPRLSLSYRFLGGAPNSAMLLEEAWPAARGARYSKDGSGEFVKPERMNHIVVPRSAFSPVTDAAGLLDHLLGVHNG